jgi:hypothetical protein
MATECPYLFPFETRRLSFSTSIDRDRPTQLLKDMDRDLFQKQAVDNRTETYKSRNDSKKAIVSYPQTLHTGSGSSNYWRVSSSCDPIQGKGM